MILQVNDGATQPTGTRAVDGADQCLHDRRCGRHTIDEHPRPRDQLQTGRVSADQQQCEDERPDPHAALFFHGGAAISGIGWRLAGGNRADGGGSFNATGVGKREGYRDLLTFDQWMGQPE